MKAIQNCLQKIVIYKIYSLEKQKMEYNDNEVYNHIDEFPPVNIITNNGNYIRQMKKSVKPCHFFP